MGVRSIRGPLPLAPTVPKYLEIVLHGALGALVINSVKVMLMVFGSPCLRQCEAMLCGKSAEAQL